MHVTRGYTVAACSGRSLSASKLAKGHRVIYS